MSGRIQFLGLGFDPMGPNQAARAIAWRARRREAFGYVATPNVDHLVRLDRNDGLRGLYQDAWLTLCDSRILELFAWISDVKLPVAPGSDIVERLFHDHIHPDDTVLVIGGNAELVRALRERYALADLRWHAPPLGLKDDAAARAQCAAFIRDNPASFIFLAVGSPQQEMIAHEVLASGGAVGVALCCGAGLDFLTGKTARAPGWMRAGRLEWLHRLVSEPARLWRRYLIDGPRILGIWRRWLAEAR
jgi:N-acetylglucosaminyldiphosphoundecaprenol N-acetyl-beta-D-mannosaminyltransferase